MNCDSLIANFSRAHVLASWAVVSTAFSLRWMSFVTLLSLSSNDVSLVPSSLNSALSKSLISSKLLLPVAVCCSFAFLDGVFSLFSLYLGTHLTEERLPDYCCFESSDGIPCSYTGKVDRGC